MFELAPSKNHNGGRCFENSASTMRLFDISQQENIYIHMYRRNLRMEPKVSENQEKCLHMRRWTPTGTFEFGLRNTFPNCQSKQSIAVSTMWNTSDIINVQKCCRLLWTWVPPTKEHLHYFSLFKNWSFAFPNVTQWISSQESRKPTRSWSDDAVLVSKVAQLFSK